MKIVQVIFNLSPGGAERLVVDLSNELSKKHEVVVLTLIDDKVDIEKRQFYCFDLSDRVTYKNLGLAVGQGFKFSTLWQVYKALKALKADIIHLHTATIVNRCVLAICLLCWNTPILQTIHTDFKVGHSTRVYKFLFKVLGRLKKMHWVALSPTNYDDMMSTYPYIHGTRIDNGRAPVVPTPLFESARAEVESMKATPESNIFLHVARCIEVKNQKMLVSAFSKFVAEGNDAELLIIGADFDSELGEAIKGLACERVHFLGTRKNIADYMLNADAFCLSSTYEGLPITILEAMLAGIPVVSTPIAAAHDVLTDGVNAIVSKDFSEEAYIKALKTITCKMSELKANSTRMKDDNPYTIKECAKKYVEFYKTL